VSFNGLLKFNSVTKQSTAEKIKDYRIKNQASIGNLFLSRIYPAIKLRIPPFEKGGLGGILNS